MDYGSSKSRGFGFVNFRDPEVAKTVLSQVHRIQGRLCEVRLPRCKVSNNSNNSNAFLVLSPYAPPGMQWIRSFLEHQNPKRSN